MTIFLRIIAALSLVSGFVGGVGSLPTGAATTVALGGMIAFTIFWWMADARDPVDESSDTPDEAAGRPKTVATPPAEQRNEG